MRQVALPLILVLTSACAVSKPAAYAPPAAVERNAGALALEPAANVVPLDATGTSIESSIASVPGQTTRLAANVVRIKPQQRRNLEAYYSENGGATWSRSGAIPLTGSNGRQYDNQGDPVMAADRAGRFYAVMLIMKGPSGVLEFSAVAVSRSDDGGKTWGNPVVVAESAWTNGSGPFNDKEWVAVDTSGGPRDGTIYAVWQEMERLLVGVPSQFYISRSTDQGRTWSQPRATSAVEPGGAMMVEVGAEGEVYIGRYSSSRRGYIAQVSTDGGETFSQPVLMSGAASGSPQQPPSRYFAYPRLHADRSFRANRGNVYFVAAISAIGPGGRRYPAPAVSRSTDGGKTWSPLREIAAPGAGDALLPTGIVNDATGELVVAWLDRRDDATGRTARVYATRSRDGGLTFDTPQPFSPAFSTDAPWLGEYNAIAVAGDKYVATFSDAAGRFSAATIAFEPRPRRRAVRR